MAGYNWRAGKSNNAVAAETQGLVVKSKITADWLKAHGIKEKVGFKFGETCSRSLNRQRCDPRHHHGDPHPRALCLRTPLLITEP